MSFNFSVEQSTKTRYAVPLLILQNELIGLHFRALTIRVQSPAFPSLALIAIFSPHLVRFYRLWSFSRFGCKRKSCSSVCFDCYFLYIARASTSLTNFSLHDSKSRPTFKKRNSGAEQWFFLSEYVIQIERTLFEIGSSRILFFCSFYFYSSYATSCWTFFRKGPSLGWSDYVSKKISKA